MRQSTTVSAGPGRPSGPARLAGAAGSLAGVDAPPAGPGAGPDPPDRLALLLLPYLLVFLGLDLQVNYLPVNFVLAAMLALVWIPRAARFRMARPILGGAVAILIFGYFLARYTAETHLLNNTTGSITAAHLLGGVGTMGLLLWARTMFPLPKVAALFGLGLLLGAVLSLRQDGGTWKYHLVAVAVLLLGLAQWSRSRLVPVGAALLLAVVAVVNDARAFSAICLIAATLALAQIVPTRKDGKRRPVVPLAVLGLLGYAAYELGTSLLTGGYLGTELQQRSIAQIETSGSLIAGGRPEWFGTWQLMKLNPLGYGLGVVPSYDDVIAAKTGMAAIGVPTDNGYIDNYMFGGQFRLHSVVADLWASFGWAGLVFAAMIIGTLFLALGRQLAERQASALVIFMVTWASWTLAFGPFYTDFPTICIALGVTLPLPRGMRADGVRADGEPSGEAATDPPAATAEPPKPPAHAPRVSHLTIGQDR